MMKAHTLRMTEGSPTRLLMVFAVPLLIGNIFQQAYNLADSIIVGRFVGAAALAAVGASASISFLFFSICHGVSGGGGIITAQYFGAGDTENVKKAIANSAYIMFGGSLLMSIIAYIAAPQVLRLVGTPEDILPDSIVYMHMCCIGLPFVGVYNYSASMLRSLGDSRTPLLFLVVSCLLNVGLDLLFVRRLNLGVFGVAFATTLAQLIAGASCLIYAIRTNPYFHLRWDHLRPDWAMCLRAVKLGVPLAMQWSLIAVSSTAVQRVVNSFGTMAVAAFTATNRIEQLVHQPYGSLSMALSTYSSQNLGAERLDRVRLGFRRGMLICGAFSLVMLAVMQAFGGSIVGVFVEDAEVIALGGRALRLTSLMYIFLALINVIRGILNGAGDVLFSMMNGIVEALTRIFLPMALLLIPGIGVWAIWWTTGLSWVISSAFCLLRYRTWLRKHPA